jgi:hypothetical protein
MSTPPPLVVHSTPNDVIQIGALLTSSCGCKETPTTLKIIPHMVSHVVGCVYRESALAAYARLQMEAAAGIERKRISTLEFEIADARRHATEGDASATTIAHDPSSTAGSRDLDMTDATAPIIDVFPTGESLTIHFLQAEIGLLQKKNVTLSKRIDVYRNQSMSENEAFLEVYSKKLEETIAILRSQYDRLRIWFHEASEKARELRKKYEPLSEDE